MASVIATAATVMLAALPLMIGTQMLISALQLDIQATPSTPSYPPFDRQQSSWSPEVRPSPDR